MNNLIKIDKAKQIGLFFLLAFPAYGCGRALFESENATEQYFGAALIIINSTMVLFIGVWFRETLRQYNEQVGNLYYLTRLFESIALASLTLDLMPTINISNDWGYFLAMAVLGLGSVPMCSLLYKHAIAPKWGAMWGAVGYAMMSFGFFMELFGKNWSMYLLGLGALWEITFAIWLIIKGGKIYNGSVILSGTLELKTNTEKVQFITPASKLLCLKHSLHPIFKFDSIRPIAYNSTSGKPVTFVAD